MSARTDRRKYRYFRVWTEEMHDRLAQLWCMDGLTLDEIAADLHSTPAAVLCQIRILGLCLTPQAVQARRARGIYRGWRKKHHDLPAASADRTARTPDLPALRPGAA